MTLHAADAPTGWIGALRRTLGRWTTGPSAYIAAMIIGLLEAVIPFITPEVFLIPLLARRGNRFWLLALCPVVGNLIAALVLYAAGAALAGPVVEPLIGWIGGEAEYQRAITWLREDGFVALFLLDLAPIPVQIVLIAAGVARYPLGLFLIAIALSRSARYLLIAFLVRIAGERARDWLESHQLEIFLVGLAVSAVLGVWMFIS